MTVFASVHGGPQANNLQTISLAFSTLVLPIH